MRSEWVGLVPRIQDFAAGVVSICGRLAALGDAVANADKLEHSPGAGIAQPRLGQPHHACIATVTVGDSAERSFRTRCSLLACRPSRSSTRRRAATTGEIGLVPFPLAITLAQVRHSAELRAAVVANSLAACC